MQNDKTQLILKSLASYIVNFPVIRSYGCHMSKLLTLVVEDASMIGKLMEMLNDIVILLKASSNDEDIKDAFRFGNSRAVAFCVTPRTQLGKRDMRMIELFLEYLQVAIADKDVRATPLLICLQKVPPELKDCTFEIHLEKSDLKIAGFGIKDIVPSYDSFALIEHMAQPYLDSEYSGLY